MPVPFVAIKLGPVIRAPRKGRKADWAAAIEGT
jgi:hypothetical protein